MRQFVSERFAVSLSRSTCLEYLHRLGFGFKRPKRGLLKADAETREAFVAEYAALAFQAQESAERIFFADEAHFRADAELRGKRVLRGEPALVDSTNPRYGEKASYYSAVCLESGEVEWMELEGNSNSGTSAAFLRQLRERHSGRLNVNWDIPPAPPRQAQEWRGGAGMAGPARSEPAAGEPPFSRWQALPGYSPDFNADEAIWGWAREEATGNLCLGTKAKVEEKVGNFLAGLDGRKEEVRRRCRTILQSRAEALPRKSKIAARVPAPTKCTSHFGFSLDLDGGSAAADLGDHDVRLLRAGRAKDGGFALTQKPLDTVRIAHKTAHLVEPLHALVALKGGDPETYRSAQLVG